MAALRSILYKYKELYAGVLDETPATFKLKGSWFENICLYSLGMIYSISSDMIMYGFGLIGQIKLALIQE